MCIRDRGVKSLFAMVLQRSSCEYRVDTGKRFIPPESTPSRSYEARCQGRLSDLLHHHPTPDQAAPSSLNGFKSKKSVPTRHEDLTPTIFMRVTRPDGSPKPRAYLSTRKPLKYYESHYARHLATERADSLWGNVFF
eukprot:TRINITY_DN2476_c0_g1_i1.p1 TRINITY_DN2476_c0_g1~~TRINITY_DN2476_c0_g1_i1.p1  ORF type:complete len:137 (+),score=18.48 TRINITY_DN2476_c0_g1_i1:122-532(+)